MKRSIIQISRHFSSELRSALRSRTCVRKLHGINSEQQTLGTLSKSLHFRNNPRLLELNLEQETNVSESIKYRVRNMELKDLPQVMELKRIQGTQDAASYWETLLEVDPQTISLAETEKGEIISVVGLLHHHDDFYFTGLYYVSEKYRCLGLGREMAAMILNRIGNSNFGLNAVPGMDRVLMKNCDLLVVEDHFKCVVNEIPSDVNPLALSDSTPDGLTIRPFQESHLPRIHEYDFLLHGHDRRSLLELNCRERESQTLVALRNDACVGFGSVKTSCQNSVRVGPLYADDPRTAEAILRGLLLAAPRHLEGFAMMTFSNNSFANDCVRKIGRPKATEYTRLYKRERLRLNTDRVYALSDFNITPY